MFDQDPPGIVAKRVALNPAVGGYDNLQDAIDNGAIGGGSSPVVRKFPFAFDTAGILTGAALYTPTIGDIILLDAWIEIDTAWDGTTPLGDVGNFTSGVGWFTSAGYGPINMWAVDDLSGFNDGQMLAGSGLITSSFVEQVFGNKVKNNLYTAGGGARVLPAKFTTAAPIKVCVSQDGSNSGADPGSTVGAAILYLVTATPA